MIDGNILLLSYFFGIIISFVISNHYFYNIFPISKVKIIDDKKWVESMELFFKKTNEEMILTTLSFSSLDKYMRVKMALENALLKEGVKIIIIGAIDKMSEGKYDKLIKSKCEVVRVSQEILDEDDRFWHHLVVVDSKHWLWYPLW